MAKEDLEAVSQPVSIKLGYLILVVLTLATAIVGSLGSINAATFYTLLRQPSWAPPPGIFGPVWTILYTMMAIVACRLWQRLRDFKHPILRAYYLQLFLNGAWSWIFFNWHLGSLGLATIALLVAVLIQLMIAAFRIDPVSTALLGPYVLWVSFAGCLNLSLWLANPQLLA